MRDAWTKARCGFSESFANDWTRRPVIYLALCARRRAPKLRRVLRLLASCGMTFVSLSSIELATVCSISKKPVVDSAHVGRGFLMPARIRLQSENPRRRAVKARDRVIPEWCAFAEPCSICRRCSRVRRK